MEILKASGNIFMKVLQDYVDISNKKFKGITVDKTSTPCRICYLYKSLQTKNWEKGKNKIKIKKYVL